jgi:DNA-binding MarR family transcriptional regulator
MGTLRRHLDPFFARAGISGSQWAILWTLYRAGEDGKPMLRVTDLGERLLIRPPSVTGVIDRLVRAGYLDRLSSPDDKRAKLIALTPAGRQLVETLHNAHDEQVTALLNVLTAADQKDLHRILEQFVTHLDTHPDPACVPAQRGSL